MYLPTLLSSLSILLASAANAIPQYHKHQNDHIPQGQPHILPPLQDQEPKRSETIITVTVPSLRIGPSDTIIVGGPAAHATTTTVPKEIPSFSFFPSSTVPVNIPSFSFFPSSTVPVNPDPEPTGGSECDGG
ncbi:hypothetical protein GGR50DRAFT_682277 [Xylaria sp. CBS 124048]|nr:hypothetical protein GGR50DRAFT_682277 [Xylaria sp. CBS 124048]